jgi:hypothetical protein
MFLRKLPMTVMLLCALSVAAENKNFKLDDLSGDQGTLKFDITFKEDILNGKNSGKKNFEILKIDGLAQLVAGSNTPQAYFKWFWDKKLKRKKSPIGLNLLLPGFKANENNSFLFTWNASKGFFDVYLNGYPARVPQTELPKWNGAKPTKFKISQGPFEISNLESAPSYLPPGKVAETIKKGAVNPFIKKGLQTSLKTLLDKKGAIVYDGAKEDPQFKEWLKEGPLKCEYKDGWELFESTNPENKNGNGHIVWWCPKEFPEDFIAEWEVKIVSERGLCIVFFAAKGVNGESIFDEKLPKRTGVFSEYTKGKIKSYHVSYHTNAAHNPGRPQVNLRKNNSFYLLAQGASGVPAGKKVHKVSLIKIKNRIIMGVDGKLVLDHTDDNADHYGAPYKDGWIGLRQMCWTAGEYRDFKVWKLK